jgi:hypothetical protein
VLDAVSGNMGAGVISAFARGELKPLSRATATIVFDHYPQAASSSLCRCCKIRTKAAVCVRRHEWNASVSTAR